MRDNRPTLPIWIGGILLALVLILISTRGGGVNSAVLMRRFAPDPNAPKAQPFQLPQVSLPHLPEGMQRTLTGLRVEVREVRRVSDQVKVSGAVTNISSAPLEIGVRAFAFRDSAGVTYAASGAGTTLQPGQSTALDLAVPLPAGRGLTLLVALPPDPPLEQVLVVETKP